MRLFAKLESCKSLVLVRFVLVFLFLNFPHGFSLKISPKPCANALGEDGTCMFVWECIKTDGKHLGTCVDGFLFGSCCGHNDTSNSIDLSTPNKQSYYPSSPFVEAITSTSSSHSVYPVRYTTTSSTTTTTTSSTTTTTPKPYTKPTATTVINNHQPIRNSTTAHWIPPKPWPSGTSSLNGQQAWPHQTSTLPSVGVHTFRPSIFSSYGTVRPHPSMTMFARPTFRPPTRPVSIFQHFFNTRPNHAPTTAAITTVQTTITTTTTTTTTTSTTTTTTTPKPKPTYNPYAAASNTVTHIANKRPAAKGSCGQPPLIPQSKVVGGKNAAFGSWPWQVSVRRTSFFGFSSTHRCGGAIIGSQWIATAGHCVDDLLLSQIRIRVGEYDFASVLEPFPYVERGAKKKVVHPSYNFFTYENDLALVQLDEPIDFQPHIAPICLPPDNINLEGRNATVTGWGRLSEGGILPSVLQEVKVPLLSNEKCKSMFLSAGRHEYIPEIFMCAGYAEGGRDSCQGDSGGPLQVQGDDGKWFLAGIISWGIGCAEPNLPGVCTRISKFKSWILNTIT